MESLEIGVIGTERLELVLLEVGHAEEMAVVMADPGLHVYIGGSPDTAEGLRARYERMVAGSPDPKVLWGNWVIRSRELACLVGTVQTTVNLGEGEAVAEVAWVVGTPWQRQGIAVEAARGLVGWLREWGASAVIAHVHPDHMASAAVAAAVGMTPTEHRHDGEVRWLLGF